MNKAMETFSNFLRIWREVMQLLVSQALNNMRGSMLSMASTDTHGPNATEEDLLGQMWKNWTIKLSPTDCLPAVWWQWPQTFAREISVL